MQVRRTREHDEIFVGGKGTEGKGSQEPTLPHFLPPPSLLPWETLGPVYMIPAKAGRDAYRDLAHNTNSNECLYDPATYPA
jgi:hypothetical protein